MTTMCYSLTLSLLLWWLMYRGIKPEFAVATTFIVTFLIWQFANARPYAISFLFILICHILCYMAYHKQRYRPLLAGLPVIMALWGNIHGGFIAGFSVLGFYGIGALIDKRYTDFKLLFLAGSLGLLSLLAFNYYQLDIITATLRTLHTDVIHYISEWQPFTFHHMMGPTLFISAFILVCNPRDKKIPLEERLMGYAWLFAATWSVRNFPIAAIMCAPLLAVGLSQSGKPKTFYVNDTLKARVASIVLALMISVLLLVPSIRDSVFTRDVITPKHDLRPAFAALNKLPHHIVLNSYTIGGAMTYYQTGTPRVFVDGRAGTAYSEGFLRDILDAWDLKNTDAFEQLVDTYHIDTLITDIEKNFYFTITSPRFANQWVEKYNDGHIAIFSKKNRLK